MGRYGMQVPGGPVSAVAQQQAAAFHAAQVPAGYSMMQLNQAMNMMNMGGAAAAGGGARADGNGGIGGGVGDGSGAVIGGGPFAMPAGPMGGGNGGGSSGGGGGIGRNPIMREQQQHGAHGMHQQMLTPGYGSPPGPGEQDRSQRLRRVFLMSRQRSRKNLILISLLSTKGRVRI